MKRAAVLILLLLAACSSKSAPTHTLTVKASGVCGSADWNAAGMTQDVQVRDPSNKLLGVATMTVENGTLPGSGTEGGWCTGTVHIPDVPETSLYQVKIGTIPGSITFHLAELRKAKWVATVSVS